MRPLLASLLFAFLALAQTMPTGPSKDAVIALV